MTASLVPLLTVTLPPLSEFVGLFAAIGCVVGVVLIAWSYRMEERENKND